MEVKNNMTLEHILEHKLLKLSLEQKKVYSNSSCWNICYKNHESLEQYDIRTYFIRANVIRTNVA
jgi:hypothetical protein